MPEITARNGYSLWPQPTPPERLIDPVAFILALIGGPLLVTALTFWILFIPVIALALGGPLYLVVGGPVLWVALRRGDTSIADMVELSVATIFVLGLLAMIGTLIHSAVLGESQIFGGVRCPIS